MISKFLSRESDLELILNLNSCYKGINDGSEKENSNNYVQYKVGQKICGEVIETIYSSNNEHKYIIFKPKNKNIVCFQCDSDSQDEYLAKISLNVAKVNSLLSLEKNIRKYLPLIAQAYMDCLSGNTNEAIKILEEIEQKIVSIHEIRCKLFYMLYCILFVVANIVVCVVLTNYEFDSIRKLQDKLTLLFKLATFGSIGGFISVAINSKKLEFEPTESIINSSVSAFTRIFISMLSAIIVYYAIKAKIILNLSDQDMSIVYVFCAAAGFSERFITSILKKGDNAVQEAETSNLSSKADING